MHADVTSSLVDASNSVAEPRITITAMKPERHAENRAGPGESDGLVGEHPAKMPTVGAADAQGRLLTALRARQHASRVPGEERSKKNAREPEEDEHPLADRGVVVCDLECIGDVVDEVVLARRDPVDRAGDRRGLRERACRVGAQPRTVDEHVDLGAGEALELVPPRRRRGLERGDDRLLEHLRADDHRVRDVDEVLELARLPAGEQRRRVGEVDHAAHRQGERCGRSGHAEIDRVAGSSLQVPRRLRTQESAIGIERAGHESDRGIAPFVLLVEREDAYGITNGRGATAERLGVEVDEGQHVGGSDSRDPADPIPQLRGCQRCRRVRRRRDDVLATRDRSLKVQVGYRRDRAVGTCHVGERSGGAAGDRADVQAGAGQTLRQRALAGGVRDAFTVERRRVVHVRERRRRFVVDHDLVRRLRAFVHDPERHGRFLARAAARPTA